MTSKYNDDFRKRSRYIIETNCSTLLIGLAEVKKKKNTQRHETFAKHFCFPQFDMSQFFLSPFQAIYLPVNCR